jgi:hypothetical protein
VRALRLASLAACSVSVAVVACSSSSAAPAATGLPCDVQDVISGTCLRCHSDPPAEGVPISLVNYADTQAYFPPAGEVVWKVMQVEIELDAMPPIPPYLTSAGRETLLDWLEAGAPRGPDAGCP